MKQLLVTLNSGARIKICGLSCEQAKYYLWQIHRLLPRRVHIVSRDHEVTIRKRSIHAACICDDDHVHRGHS